MRRGLAIALAIALVTVLGGCSDEGRDAVQPAPAPVPTTTTTTTATAPAAPAVPAPAQGTLRAELTEVHDFRGPPDKGFLLLTLARGQARICYEIRLRETDRPTEVHVHEGTATVATLNPQMGTPGQAGEGERAGRGGYAGTTRCEPADPDLVERLLGDPARFAAEVHTALAPAGAVRGTFSPAP